jgi:hypothetical protein
MVNHTKGKAFGLIFMETIMKAFGVKEISLVEKLKQNKDMKLRESMYLQKVH